MRMLLEHPRSELTPDFGLADAFNDLDTSVAQDERSRAVHSRMRVAHAEDDAGDAALGDGLRARRCSAMKGARLKGGVQSRTDHTLPAGLSVARRGNLRVILTRAKGVAAPDKLALLTHDHAADPWVVARGTARQFRLFDREAHPRLMFVSHRLGITGEVSKSTVILRQRSDM